MSTPANIAAILNQLPSVNGDIEVGLSVGVDRSIDDKFKLPIYTAIQNEDRRAIAFASALWAYDKFKGQFQKYYTVSAYCAVAYGLVRSNDGDSKADTGELPEVGNRADAIKLMLTEENVQKCILMMVATKINLWLINHHVGTPKLQSFAKKVATVHLNCTSANEEEIASLMHTVGHWCSTKYILAKLGMIPVDSSVVYASVGSFDFNISEDVKLRVSSPPAGTHRHNLVYLITKRLVGHFIAPYSNVLIDVGPYLNTYHEMLKKKHLYHVGSLYLCGDKVKEFSDTDANAVLGRLTTFITTFYKNSTICASPHVSRNGRNMCENYEDYDPNYSNLCNGLKAQILNVTPTDLLDKIKSRMSDKEGLSDEFINSVKKSVGSSIVPAVRTPAIKRAKRKAGPTTPSRTSAERSAKTRRAVTSEEELADTSDEEYKAEDTTIREDAQWTDRDVPAIDVSLARAICRVRFQSLAGNDKKAFVNDMAEAIKVAFTPAYAEALLDSIDNIEWTGISDEEKPVYQVDKLLRILKTHDLSDEDDMQT